MKRPQRAGAAVMNANKIYRGRTQYRMSSQGFFVTLVVRFIVYSGTAMVLHLYPSALSRQIGHIVELVAIVLSHLTDAELYNAMQVNKAWDKEAVRLLWHSPVDGRLLVSSLADEDVASHAALVRHLGYTPNTGKKIDEDGWGYSLPFSFTRDLPVLPGLASIDRSYASLSNRTVEKLNALFVPTIKTVSMHDFADRDVPHLDVVDNSQWFKVMSQNCHLLENITPGVEPLVSTKGTRNSSKLNLIPSHLS
ncbi:hypothetical protein E4T47_05042 [Aureobasidium subglaciale]|nr:hypothetical protein E4T47_05042 [Aureobasidium subglaciale]